MTGLKQINLLEGSGNLIDGNVRELSEIIDALRGMKSENASSQDGFTKDLFKDSEVTKKHSRVVR